MTSPREATRIADLDATGLATLFRQGTVSPVEIVRDVFERIDAVNPAINAFCHLDPEGALAAARESETRWQSGNPIGPLDGIPVSIKDLTAVRDMPLRKGSLTTDTAPSQEDSPYTACMRAAGSVILGKTTTPEFGWKGVTDSKLTGITRNPWNLERTPGGSSGGAAAAAALNLGCLHQGSDGGGSIRIPCALTGTVGIKPTFGWVPQLPSSVMTLLSHLGPIGRSVDDLVLMLDAVARPDGRDWYAQARGPLPWTERAASSVAGLRIAYSPTLGYADLHPDVRAVVDRAVKALEDLGAHVDPVDPGFDDPIDLFTTFWFSGAARIFEGLGAADRERMDPGLVAAGEAGARLSALDYVKADAARAELGARMHVFHETYDLLVTPSVAVTAFKAGQDTPDPESDGHWTHWTPYSYPFNITQQPAASVPCGLAADGLPVGLHLVGGRNCDALVLQAAAAFLAAHPPAFPSEPMTKPD